MLRYFRKLSNIIIIFTVITVGHAAELNPPPAYWDAILGPTKNEITIRVVPRVCMKDVVAKVTVFDEKNNQISVVSVDFNKEGMAEVCPGTEYEKKIVHNIPGAASAQGELMFGKLVSSSPKARVEINSDMLTNGIPPRN